MAETLVVALGGNAITRPGEPGTIPQQFEHTAETLNRLRPLFQSDARIVITHGNGPQIGNILIRVEEGERRVPRLPLDTCVSDSQGGMGYMIQRVACEMFRRENIARGVVTLITQVLVNEGDPGMVHPCKPIGPFYGRDEIERIRAERAHWELGEMEPGRWRRLVASPRSWSPARSPARASRRRIRRSQSHPGRGVAPPPEQMKSRAAPYGKPGFFRAGLGPATIRFVAKSSLIRPRAALGRSIPRRSGWSSTIPIAHAPTRVPTGPCSLPSERR